jgi:hypothetical protein
MESIGGWAFACIHQGWWALLRFVSDIWQKLSI